MNTTQKKIVFAIAEAALLTIGMLIVPLFLAIDILFFKNRVSEISLTQVTQEALLFASAAMFGIRAWRRPEARGFLVLVSGFLACMFIRELDEVFNLVSDGFWVWPALISAAASIGYAMTCRGTVIEPMGRYVGTKSQIFVLIGLTVVLVFSRVIGSGHLFWRHIMGGSYTPLFKNAIQEGLEFLGYIFIFYGACLLLCQREDAEGCQKSS